MPGGHLSSGALVRPDPEDAALRSILGSRLGLACLVGAALAWPGAASALPILAIDLDPATPGIQTTAQIGVGEQLSFDVVIVNVDAGAPLNAFQLEVRFDAARLSGVSVVVGPFLAPPTLPIEQGFGTGTALLAATTLGPGGASGAGVLGTIRLEGVSPGTSPLTLANVVLSQPFGVELGVGGLGSAELIVVPETGSGVAVGFGLLLLRLRLPRSR
jgi:hypothetical protein